MSEDWQFVALGEIAAAEPSAISKPYGSAILKSDYRESGVPVVRGVNLADGVFHDDSFVFIDESVAARMPGARLKAGDLVVTHRGTVGQVSMIPRSPQYNDYVASTSQVKVRLDESRAVPEFYYYYFSSPQGRQAILENVSTVGVPGLVQPVATVKRLTVPAPPKSVQNTIAEFLGALDDKIAANTKLAAVADDLAVNFFKNAVREASYGPATFADLAKVSGGGTPSTKIPEYWDGAVPWATPTDITSLSGPYLESTTRSITELGLQNCSSELYPAGSILMTSRATIGAFAVAQRPIAVNQGFIVIQPQDVPLYWMFHEMRSRVDEFISMANGATFLELSRGNFKKFTVRLAAPEIMSGFSTKAKALHESASASLVENGKLAEIRDTLLPHLMSGRLTIKDAEKIVEGAL